MKTQFTVAMAGMLVPAAILAAIDEIELKDWKLQDATVIEAQAKKEGWYKQNSACQPTEGERLSLNGFDAKGWYKATVPGTVLTTLVDNGVYPEPTYGENNRPETIPDDLCRRDWWYRTKVRVPDSFKDKTVWLNFDGINYHAEIWVNGRITGRMTGAFKRRSFDLAKSGDAKAGKDISIAVRISPQPTVGIPSEHTMGTTGGPCGGVARLDGPVIGCSVGWDWLSGVRDREAGIWRKVTLSATGDAKLLDPQVVTDLPKLPKLDTATVCVNVPVRNLSEKPLDGVVTVAFDSVKVSKKVSLGPSETKTVAFAPAEFAALTVKNPRLWWPNGLGEPALHDMTISLEAAGKASDEKKLRFGIRKFEYFAGNKPEFALAVNGVRVFMKGGNWGLDEMLKRVRRERIDHQVRLHREENFNMIRDWGGMSQSDELADACDKYGIMLWEDFWQFNSIDPVNTDFYFAHVTDTVPEGPRPHPPLPGELRRRLRLQFRRPVRLGAAGALLAVHGRPVVAQERDVQDGDRRRVDPDDRVAHGDVPEERLGRHHGRLGRAQHVRRRRAQVPALHGHALRRGEELPGLRPQGPAHELRDAPRHLRRAHRAHVRADGGRAPLDEHPRAAEPHLAVVHVRPRHARLVLRHQEGVRRPVRLGAAEKRKLGDVKWPDGLSKVHFMKAELFDASGKLVDDNFYWHNRACNPAKAEELKDDNKIVRYDDLRDLEKLPMVTLETRAKTIERDGKVYVGVVLTNPSSSVALMAHLQLRGAKSGRRVLPTTYSDNYVSLLPGEKKRILVSCDKAQLQGEAPFVTVDGWNVTAAKSELVGPNEVAMVDAPQWAHQKGFGFLPKPLVAKDVVRINCGGYNRGNFEKDPGFLEAPVGFRTEDMDLSECANPGPADMYRTVRWSESTYSNLLTRANALYTVRLHFAESEKSKCDGKNRMDVLVNGEPILKDFDPAFAGLYKAGVKEVKHVKSDARGYVNLSFVKGKKIGNESRDPRINGYEIIPE